VSRFKIFKIKYSFSAEEDMISGRPRKEGLLMIRYGIENTLFLSCIKLCIRIADFCLIEAQDNCSY
jgi:hypothetical protein